MRLFSSSGEGKRFEKGRKKLEKTTSGTASGTDKKHQGRALIASGTEKTTQHAALIASGTDKKNANAGH